MPQSEGKEVAVRESASPWQTGRAGEERPPPQWVIMGIQMPGGGVAVLASSTLTHAEMRRRFIGEVRQSVLGKLHLRQEHNAVLIECGGFQFVHGETYLEAMNSLATVWRPPELEAR